MKHRIVPLSKEKWKGAVLPIGYTTDQYYDVQVKRLDNGFNVKIEKKDFAEPVTRSPENEDFPDRLYQDHWDDPSAWGVISDGHLVAAIETNPEEWSNRLRITELWVSREYRKQGLGHALMEIAKEKARNGKRRAVILETQSSNVNAIDFYQHEGFTLIGLDTCCYRNDDLERKEVRLEFGWFPTDHRKST